MSSRSKISLPHWLNFPAHEYCTRLYDCKSASHKEEYGGHTSDFGQVDRVPKCVVTCWGGTADSSISRPPG